MNKSLKFVYFFNYFAFNICNLKKMTSRKDLLLQSLTCVGNNSPNIYASLTNTPFYIYERNDGMLACYNNRCLWEWRAVFATLFLHDGYSKTVLTRNNKTKVTLFVKFDNGKK